MNNKEESKNVSLDVEENLHNIYEQAKEGDLLDKFIKDTNYMEMKQYCTLLLDRASEVDMKIYDMISVLMHYINEQEDHTFEDKALTKLFINKINFIYDKYIKESDRV